ncbi:class B sortase [uncultured Anaerococcus sp.]|uniref:class B sortase n=1 Tax=uncultured Anaerococcus sp. TaxID=293428 RepID=UPI0025D27B8F|nr:class B sortase [uncultured Anaerococcus sp.]
MKKTYTYILWFLALLVFFLTLKKTNEFGQSWNEAYLARLEQERFYRSRISKNSEAEINEIIKIADRKRELEIFKQRIRDEIKRESEYHASHVRDLAKDHPQVKGRIIIPGTDIDFPVVQGDDNEFYLNHHFDNTYYINGSVFIDHLHQGDFSDQNTVLYGHNVRIGYIFNDLNKFRDKNFVKDHSEIIIDTPKERRFFDIVSAMDIGEDENYRFYSFEDDEFESYLNLIKENNILEEKPLPKKEDKLLTLSTCSDINDKFAIVAVEKTADYKRKKEDDQVKSFRPASRRGLTNTLIY